MANQIYAKFPKTEYAEGSNITLSNTLKGKLDFEKIYQEVEYIESDTVSQYIDTGVIPTTNTKINIDFAFMGGGEGTGWLPAYGVKETDAHTRFSLFINNGSNKITPNYSLFDPGNNSSVVLTTGQKYNLRNDKGQFYVDNVLQSSISTTDTLSTGTKSIYLFANNNNGSVDNRKIQLRIYNCKFFESTALVRNFIPCYRKSDNVIGLYDKVEEKFYTNSGTGTFTKGADVGTGFNEIIGYGDTKQEGTPTPDSPQDIEVVRGTQTVYIKDENNNIIDTKTINLGEYEFAKIGNYVDTIEYDVDEDKVYKNKAINKKIFTGDEPFNMSNEYGGGYSFFLLWSNNNLLGKTNTQFKCNIATYVSTIQDYGVSKIFSDLGMAMNLYSSSEVSSTEQFKAKLKALYDNGTPCYIVYVLAEAVKQEITGTLKDQIKALYYSHSFTGTTIIEIDGQLPLIIKVRALKGE